MQTSMALGRRQRLPAAACVAAVVALAVVPGSDQSIRASDGAGPAPTAASAAQLSPGWTLDTPLPEKRVTLAAVRGADGTIYTFSRSPTVDAFNPAAHMWSRRAPQVLGPATGVTLGPNGMIYVIAGTTVARYNPASNTWTQRVPAPIERYDAAAVAGNDGKIYVLGGSIPDPADSTVTLYTRRLEVYDPRTNTWQVKAPMPTAREGLGAAVGKDGTIYAIGGGVYRYPRSPIIQCFAVVEAYHPKSNTWSKATPLPRPMCGVTAGTTTAGTLVVLGGSTVTGGEQGSHITPATGTVVALHPNATKWSTLSRTPFPRKHAGAVIEPDGTVYVIGGADAFGHATATVQRFTARK